MRFPVPKVTLDMWFRIWTPGGLSSHLVLVLVWCLSGSPEDPLFRGPGPVGQRQVPGGLDQRQVRPVRRPQIRDGTLPEQGGPRDCQPEVERGLRGASSWFTTIMSERHLILTVCVSSGKVAHFFDINTVLLIYYN